MRVSPWQWYRGRGLSSIRGDGPMSTRVAVVGAGIVGPAAASALRRAGVTVRCFEQATPGHAESAGLTRIFRHAHGDPALVHLAMQARANWGAWERRYGRRR